MGSYRLRKWIGDELDIYNWRNDEDNELIFRGAIRNKSELKRVLSMVGIPQ